MVEGFHRPTTVEEAMALKAELADRACFIGGGTQVNSLEFPRSPTHLISLDGLDLDDARCDDTEWSIGACCTIQELIDSPDVPECVKAAGRQIVNRNLRNMATIGGHLAGVGSSGEMIPLIIALDATVDANTPDGPVSMSAFVYVAAPRPNMLVLRIRIPRTDPPRFVAIDKVARMANDVPIFSVAVTLAKDGETIRNPIIALGGSAEHVVRLDSVEDKLDGLPLPARDLIETWVADAVTPTGDLRGSAAYKRHLAGVVVAATVCRAYHGEGGQVV